MKMKIRDMTIDQIVKFCNKRSACDECPFLNYSGHLCVFWEDGFDLDIAEKEIDVDDVSLAPIDIYNRFKEEFPEMLEGVIDWEYDPDLIGNKRIVIRRCRGPLTEERWIYDYEDNDMRRLVGDKK